MPHSVICLVFTLAYILHFAQSQISPTTANASGTFYIASVYNDSGDYFKDASITCSASSYCHIICDVAYGCEGLHVSATSPSTTLTVQCLDIMSCSEAVIDTNTANSVQLSCGGHYACRSMELQASNVKNNVSILCNGNDACHRATFNTSAVGNSVTMTCASFRACAFVRIFCPKDALCNVNCSATARVHDASCYNTQFHFATKLTHKLSLDCSTDSEKGCSDARFVCEDTGRSDSLIFSNSTWDCDDHACCVLGGNISCSSGELCQIDCDSQNCNSNIIDASSATSLSLDCGANGCKSALIYCPFGASASCNIKCPESKSCEYVSIYTDTNQMQQLFVECESLYSCQYLDLQLNSVQITEVAINCNSTSSCKYMNLQFNGSEINNLQLICAGSYSCSQSTIKSSISHLDIVCADRMSCDNMQLEAMISVNSNIYCGAKEACISAHIDLISTQSDLNVNITCADINKFEEYSSGACNKAKINIYGHNNGTKTNNVSYVCDTYDCAGATLNVYDVYWIDAECNDLSACEYSLNATTSQHLAVKCSGFKGCYNTHVFCPIDGSCDFDCLDLDACNTMKVEIVNNIYDELNIKCSDPFYGCDYDEILIYCMDSAQYGKLLWSSYYQSMVCYGVCCPHNPSSYLVYNTVSNHITDATSSILSETTLISSAKMDTEHETTFYDMALNYNSTAIVLSVILVVIVFVVICFKRMNDKIKVLQKFAEKQQNVSNDNNQNTEMTNSSNTNKQQFDFVADNDQDDDVTIPFNCAYNHN